MIRAVVGVGRLGPLVHVACFASRAAFSRMSFGHTYVTHARAVRFVHAFCCDIVVLVFGSSVSCRFCLALVPVSFLCFAYCFSSLFVIFTFCASVFVWILFAFVLPLHLLAVLGLRLPEVTCLLWIYVMHFHCLFMTML